MWRLSETLDKCKSVSLSAGWSIVRLQPIAEGHKELSAVWTQQRRQRVEVTWHRAGLFISRREQLKFYLALISNKHFSEFFPIIVDAKSVLSSVKNVWFWNQRCPCHQAPCGRPQGGARGTRLVQIWEERWTHSQTGVLSRGEKDFNLIQFITSCPVLSVRFSIAIL